MIFFILIYLGIGACVAYGWKRVIGRWDVFDFVFWPLVMFIDNELRDIVYCGWSDDPSAAINEYFDERYTRRG